MMTSGVATAPSVSRDVISLVPVRIPGHCCPASLVSTNERLGLTAFQLDVGDSLAGVLNFETPDWQVVDEAGGFVDVLHPQRIFYADVDEPLRSEAISKLRHHGLAAFVQPLTRAAWQSVPSTYIVCEQDQAIPVPAQESMSHRSERVLRLDSSHSPFLSRPRELADLLRGELATSATKTPSS